MWTEKVTFFLVAGFQRALAKVPSAVFQASVPGVQKYTIANRAACLLVKFGEYSLAGIFCGFVGQGVANSLMILKYESRSFSGASFPISNLLSFVALRKTVKCFGGVQISSVEEHIGMFRPTKNLAIAFSTRLAKT